MRSQSDWLAWRCEDLILSIGSIFPIEIPISSVEVEATYITTILSLFVRAS